MSVNKSNILFIINPISGGKKKSSLPALIDQYLDKEKFAPIYAFTEYIGHAAELAEEAEKKNYDIIVAVGGDGTINEVASKLVHSSKVLAIIPFGSGNGLARHLQIPLNTEKALLLLNKPTIKKIDVGLINSQAFFCTAGLGFDAHIGEVFAGMKGRGLFGYIKSVVKEYFSYISEEYEVEINGRKKRHRAFIVTAANAGQYGNNVYIAPQANISDGLLDLCIVKPFSVFRLPSMALRVFRRSIHKSRFTTTIQAKKITIKRKNKGAYHIDGEPFEGDKLFTIEINENALSVLVI